MYLITGARKTLLAISKHPYLTVLLLFLQLLLAASLFFTMFTYQTQLIYDATALLENQPLETAAYPQPDLSKNILTLYQHYTSFVNTAKLLLRWLVLLLLVGGGILWWLSHRLLAENVRTGKLLLTYIISVIVILLPGLLGGYYSLKLLIIRESPELLERTLRDLGIVLLVSYYLLLVALALLPTTGGKELLKRWWKTALSVHKTIPVLLINAVIIAGFLALLLWKMWFWALIPLLVLLPLLRLFWISCLKEIAEKEPLLKKPVNQNPD